MDIHQFKGRLNTTGRQNVGYTSSNHVRSLFDEWPEAMTALAQSDAEIINIGSVPHRSPFRYPGGKTWLIPRIRKWLRSVNPTPFKLVEPFAGGGTVGLSAAFEGLVEHVVLIELDSLVASVWKTILGPDSKWLGDTILKFEMSQQNVLAALTTNATTTRELAFQTILRNRINRGGILAPGAGVSNYGEKGRGLLSRWYPVTLQRRISEIALIVERISFIEGDGLGYLSSAAEDHDTAYFIDPPYTARNSKSAGSRLYKHAALDHDLLFDTVNRVKGDFLMTYDNSPGVIDLAVSRGLDILPVPMKNTHHAKMTELLIGRDLDWARK